MSRLGKSFKNRFLRRALAMALAGMMVMSSMPVSLAAEQSNAKTSVESEVQERTEEASEDTGISQDETSEKVETEEQESKKSTEESKTDSKEETNIEESEKETEAATAKETDSAVHETEASQTETDVETDTEEMGTEQTTEEEENAAAISDAVLADGHMKAVWGVDSSLEKIEGTVGTYANAENDILFIDATAGKFAYSEDSNKEGRFQTNLGTKIYVPVVGNKAKITIKLNDVGTVENLFSAYLSVGLDDDKVIDKNCTKVTGKYGSTIIECELGYGQDEAGTVCLKFLKNNYIQGITVACGDAASDEYESTEGDDEAFIKYSQEGFASSYGTNGVTGGGLLKKGVSENYYEVNTADAFLKALEKIKSSGEKSVIEITADIGLGSKEVTVGNYKNNIIKENAETPLCHPTLKTTGVSDLTLDGFRDLTIFSSNGSSILHTNIILKRSKNIIFRNIKFDELWEWDEGGTDSNGKTCKPGDYDRNDWDYLCIDQDCDGIWIDHCTFYKAYDGVVDIKNPASDGKQRVTISWCEFLPASEIKDGKPEFFDRQMTELESNKSSYSYYNQLRTTEGFQLEQVRMYAYGQKKTHLFGQGDEATNAIGIRVTLANNHYNNSMDRMPRLRYGKVHEYNCIMDATEIYAAKKEMNGTSHIVSNGASSTCGGEILLENCYIKDIKNALNSGNGSSPIGYIKAINSKYSFEGKETDVINPTNNTSHVNDKDKEPLITDDTAFKEALPYSGYTTYNASSLDTAVKPNAGAGKLTLSEVQWEKTSYGARAGYETREEGKYGGDSLNPPVGYENSLILNANDLIAEEITKTIKLNDHYTLAGTAAGTVTIKQITEITIGEKSFTKAISLSGQGNAAKSAIAVNAPREGTLTVYASGAVVLENSSNEPQNGTSTVTGITEYTIGAAGTYYFYSSDRGSDVYYIEFSDKTQPPENEITDIFRFRAGDYEDTTKPLEADITLPDNPYFTVKKGSEINKSVLTIEGENFTKRVKFGGVGSLEEKSIQIKSLGKGTLTIYASSSSDTTRTVRLLDSKGSKVDEKAGVGKNAKFTLNIPEKGIYYVISAGSGLYIYGIDFEVTYKEGETLPEDPDNPDNPETDPPVFTAPQPTDGKVYGEEDGKESAKTVYNIEGYAASANVTGGGLLTEDSANYYEVTNEQEFINALNSVRSLGTEGGLKPPAEIQPAVIEIKNDLNLGDIELLAQGIDIAQSPAKTVMEKFKDAKRPLMHPTLKETTGVSAIKLNYFHNLTIFSKNGAAIKHCGIKFEGDTSNIIIRNITFDEFWEWDEETSGSYDRNDWDYIAIGEQTDGLWIDHCTFYKAYDGMLDIQGDKDKKIINQRVTVSWCEFLPGSKNNTFFNEQMAWLEKHIDETTYYKKLRQSMSKEDVWWYAYGQKKAMLFGPDNTADYSSMIRATVANNHYKNIMDRMPRLRFGKVHEYNCVLDAQNLYTKKTGSSGLSSYITSQGAISTCGGEMLLENCYMRGILHPLYSGNGDSPRGKINAEQSIYYMDGNLQGEVKIEANGLESGQGALKTDPTAFKEALPYNDYITYDATKLYSKVVPYAGAGKLTMSTVQWERTDYSSRSGDESSSTSQAPEKEPEGPNDELPNTPWDDTTQTVAKPVATPGSESQATAVAAGTKVVLESEGADSIYFTTGTTPEDTADPKNPQSIRETYNAEKGIVITDAVTIKAVAYKGGKYSEVATYTYTIISGDLPTVAAPFAKDWPSETQFPSTGGSVTLEAEDGAVIYYLKNSEAIAEMPDAASELYNGPIAITAETYIRAVAIKDGVTSTALDLHYTVAAEGEVIMPVARPASGEVAKGTKIELFTTEAVDNIYYRTDGLDPKTDGRLTYDKNTGIIINEETTIRAVAEKDGKYSQEVNFVYTIKSDDTPPDPDDPDKPVVKKIRLDDKNCVITVPSAIYNSKLGNKQSTAYVIYRYTDENGNENHVRFVEGVDYKAEWKKDGTNYSVILTGSGRTKEGRDVDTYVIDEKSVKEISYKVYTSAKDSSLVNISKAKVDFSAKKKLELKNAYYTGYAYEIKVGDLDFSKDKSGLKNVPKENLRIACSNNINAGKATVTISVDPEYSDGKYAGVKTLTFKIKKAALNKKPEKATALVEFDKKASDEQQYMGSVIEAKNLKVKPKNGKEGSLRKNEDYTVTYKNSVKSGIVTVNVTVKGVGNNLSGSWSGSFTIKQLDLSDKTLTFDTNEGKLPYSPKGAKLGTITVTKDGKVCTLRAGVDYTAKYVYTDKAKKYDVGGKVTATITGKGLCKGTMTFKDLEIIKADFDKHINVSDDVTADSDAFKADKGKALSKAVTVTDAAGVKLSLNKDYKIIDIKGVSDTEEKTFTIQPIGKNAKNYTGTKIISYRVAKNLAKDKNFIFNKDLEKKDPLAYDGRNPVKLTTAEIDKYINKNISTDNPNYDTRTYRLGGKNANIEIVPGTYKNNAKKGTAQVTVRGIAGVDGGFYGQKVLKFKIVEK